MSALAFLAATALLQADPVRQEVVGAYRNYTHPKGTDEDRIRIVEGVAALGPAALWHLQTHGDSLRDEPLRRLRYMVRAVQREILRRADDPAGAATIDQLQGAAVTIDLNDAPLEALLDELRVTGVNLAADPAESEALAGLRITIAAEGSVEHVLDRVLPELRLDFHPLAGLVVIARREKLWKEGILPEREVPPDPLAGAIETQIAALRQEGDPAREAEARLLEIGWPALAALEAAAPENPRAALLAARVRGSRERDFLHPPGPRSRELSREERDVLTVFWSRTREVSINFRAAPLAEILRAIERIHEVPVRLDPALPESWGRKKVTFAVRNLPAGNLLEFLAAASGQELRIEKDGFAVVPRSTAK